MPKSKIAPLFSEARKLEGEGKAAYLARGNVDRETSDFVLRLKHTMVKRLAPDNPDLDGGEVIRDLRARDTEYLLQSSNLLLSAIINNDSELFRKIADVLERDATNGEKIVNNRLRSQPTDKLAHDIALWASMKKKPCFTELWEWLAQHRPAYANLKTAGKVKSAQVSIRRTAKAIGIVFVREKPGTRQS